MKSREKGNGRASERRSGFDRRLADEASYKGAERRKSALRRKTDRAADKPIKR